MTATFSPGPAAHPPGAAGARGPHASPHRSRVWTAGELPVPPVVGIAGSDLEEGPAATHGHPGQRPGPALTVTRQGLYALKRVTTATRKQLELIR